MFFNLPRLRKHKFLLRFPLIVIVLLALVSVGISSPSAGLYDQYKDLQRKIEETKQEIDRLQGEEKSLANQIAYLDNQIYLTELEIQAKEEEIKILSADISDLTLRLDRISAFLNYQEEVFVARARSAYSSDQLSPFDIVLGADQLDDAFRKIKYLRVLEAQDREVLEQMQETKTSFNEQKTTLENKRTEVERLKTEVEDQKISLERQRADRAYLLDVTRNSEEQYKRLLEQQQAELAAIQAALAAQGEPIGPVSRGQIIAWEGNTGCVCSYEYGCNPQPWPYGSHVHFMVVKNGYFVNPLPYLNSGALKWPEDMSSAVVKQYFSSSHPAIDFAYPRSFSKYSRPIFASEGGDAYRFQDAYAYCSWGNNGGRAYGVKVIHNNGLTTIYYHVQAPSN